MKFIILGVLIAFSFGVSAQKVRGRVVEQTAEGKAGLPGANVYWLGTTEGGGTDADGYFTVKWNPVGRLVVSFIGYRQDTVTVADINTELEIVLQSGELLEEVNVVKRGNTTIMSTKGPLIEQVITGEELCKAACCNLGESFTTNASVDVAYADAVTGAKQIQLLGLTGRYVQMMTENIPNFRGVSSLYGLSYVPGPWMSAISVSKGAGSVINGYEAIAGQISVDYKKPLSSEKVFGNVYASDEGMLEVNANAGVVLNAKWSTAVLLHGDWMNRELDGNHDGFLDMPKKTQYNVMNRWQYKTDMWNVQFGGKVLDETRLGGQKGFRKEKRGEVGAGNLYGIGIDTRRYEGFLKWGYLMPAYENTSMALILNYTDHDQDSYYGGRNYGVRQRTVFANYIYQSVFGEGENHKYSAGLTFNYDDYQECFNDYLAERGEVTPTVSFDRQERVYGAFFQYTGHFWEKLTVMAGLRYDYHNLYDGFFTPRLHIAYTPDDFTMLKFSAGTGARAANILADNGYLLASSHPMYVNGKLLAFHADEVGRLKMEKAWNFGVQLNRKFVVFDRMLNINLDYYRTDFTNQVVVDNETDPGRVNFYNLDGDSYSNCYQVEVKYELIPRLDVVGAYRYNDVRTTIGQELVRVALQSRYKGLVNLSYYTNMRKWQFDFTAQFNGPGRLPGDMGRFESFRIMNAQVSKFFRKWSVYAGCENIGDFMQMHPIIAADAPWSREFDSSKIWGPVHGRKFYVGVRFGIDRD
ncbi:TonB-dependent receptor [Odoribacter lunatus]|uniref:TonB-dependent receptor n=1 Tax=Odoribacter lunatus TaxID=2941335 RepID=UPI00203ABA4F|nr:TonB-dependent receptor [Odoribacter lunatus]